MTIVIELPYQRPPLTPNQRLHWSVRARLTREIRETAGMCARSAKLPSLGRSEVTTVWFVPDRRRRDAGSLSLTTKAALDGLVDAGVWPDDNTTWVAQESYRIEMDKSRPRIEIHIQEAQ
ncbi:hypothetical protein [Gordonia sp. AC31]|uniref:hypothetical protein n=1 Tax=Gordonia sp. AC31 TaxID=2962571 RepID=UPI002881B05A|nr:hypothetical protein [Gordonia sp. AC31]MDT0223484.1 hypothetical protein [Gordonia sp. AC31]